MALTPRARSRKLDIHPLTKGRWPDLVELFSPTGEFDRRRLLLHVLPEVGWISLGPREDYARLKRSPIMKPVNDKRVWSIVCFYVDRRVRGHGVSGKLLIPATDYARSRGARLLEAYPIDKENRSHPDFMFFGAKSMYDRADFREVARHTDTRPSCGGRCGRPARRRKKRLERRLSSV